jgi:hypothetical protein
VSTWLSNYGITRVSEFDTSLGTVGAGNHFAELCSVEKIVDEPTAEQLGVLAGGLYLLGMQNAFSGPNIYIHLVSQSTQDLEAWVLPSWLEKRQRNQIRTFHQIHRIFKNI